MLSAIARLTSRHARWVLAGALLFAALAGGLGVGVESHLKAAGFTDPNSESERANAQLSHALGFSAQPGLVVLIRARDGRPLDVRSPAIRTEIERLAGQLSKAAYVGKVTDPLTDPTARALIASDGSSVALTAQLTTDDLEDLGGVTDRSARALVTSDVVRVSFGGYAPSFREVNDQTRRDLTNAELIAFPIIALLLLLVFRSLVAALIPLLVGGLSLAGTLLVLRIMSSLTGTSSYALNVASALSLGLAVDYALLLVSRYREEVALHGDRSLAQDRAIHSAGRAVLFSGLTVAAAMLALTAMPQRFLYSIGAAGASVGVLSALIALLVVPSLLKALGGRIDALPLGRRPSAEADSLPWLRVARFVMRRPVWIVLATTGLMLALAAPLFGTHLIGPSAQAVPPGQQSYEANAYLDAHYSRVITEGVAIVVPGNPSDASLADIERRVATTPHVSFAAPFQRAADVAYTTAALDGPALDDSSQNAVNALREIPGVMVAGNTAAFIDEKRSLSDNARLVVALIVGLTLALLFLLTGSVLLPLKTLLMNTLTLAACLGILVTVFEKKVLVGLLNYPGPYSVEVTSLVFLFVVTFALATDYAVLVISRIKELHDGGMSNADATAHGIARTGRIITAAAVMIAVVFAAFAVSPVFFMKQIAVGMALGVVLDATIVRGLLVPALMRLLGEANWWAPAPLARFQRRFGIREG